MAEAKHALEILSREPSAQRIAELRREAEIARRLDRAEDRAEGREEGREQGRIEELRNSIESFCGAFGIELSDERRAALDALDTTGLKALRDALYAQRTWP
jgi:hypothetical protein